MASIDTRSREILFQILQSEKPVQIEKLANKLDISISAVSYSLRSANSWLSFRNLKFDKRQDNYISIDISEARKKELISELKELDSKSLVLSQVERRRYILLSLLTKNEPLLSKQFAFNLGVSRPTILSDLDNVEKWLTKFDIVLQRKPGWGFSLEGKEKDFRNAIENVLIESIGEISLLALYQGEHNSFFSKVTEVNTIFSPIPFTLNSLNLDFCGYLVEEIEEMSDFSFSDSSHISLAVFLAVLITRNMNNQFVEPYSSDILPRLGENALEIADRTVEKINQRFSIKIHENERENIAIRISTIRSRQAISADDPITNDYLSANEIEAMVLEMIEEASKSLHPLLSIDQKLKKGLIIHIKPAINRLIFRLPIRNLLLDEIKKKYPYIYSVSEKSSQVMGEKLGCLIPQEEIGFIAMHFAAAMERLRTVSKNRVKTLVVCGGGCATAWMLVSRLQAEFSEIEILQVCSAIDLTREALNLKGIDLIISTIPLENTNLPTVVVSPLLNESELEVIKDTIEDSFDESFNIHAPSPKELPITSLLKENTIQLNIQAKDWQEAVVKSCSPLIAQGLIESKYIEGIKELLTEHGPYMVLSKSVVLLHAMIGYGVNELCMSLTTFASPVNFGHRTNDPVSVAITFATVDSRSHLKALSQLSRLLGDSGLIEQIKKSCSASDAENILNAAFSKN